MKVQFIGTETRTNSFGVFEPGETYDVSKEVGETLLTAKELFIIPGSKAKAKNAGSQVVPESDDAGNKYKAFNVTELKSMVRERGLTTERGARRVTLVQVLVDNDDKADGEPKEIVVDDGVIYKDEVSGDEVTGTVIEIIDGVATVESVDNNDICNVAIEDLTLVEKENDNS